MMVSFCDALDEPYLAIVMDKAWFHGIRDDLVPWLLERNVSIAGDDYNGLMFLMDHETRVEFTLRWG